MLKDDQTVASLGISESDFIVCMVSKEVAKVRNLSSDFFRLHYWKIDRAGGTTRDSTFGVRAANIILTP